MPGSVAVDSYTYGVKSSPDLSTIDLLITKADIVVMDKDRPTTVYMLVELKKPKLKDGKDRLRSYCNATGAPISIWTNGD
jgi:Type I restriction enzyme R protein N terminus (HSDR_N)